MDKKTAQLKMVLGAILIALGAFGVKMFADGFIAYGQLDQLLLP